MSKLPFREDPYLTARDAAVIAVRDVRNTAGIGAIAVATIRSEAKGSKRVTLVLA